MAALTAPRTPAILNGHMINIDGAAYLDVSEAAERLGVKPETLYAYVSRGLLRSYKQGIRRRRLYLVSEIEALLSLHRPELQANGGMLVANEQQPAPQSGGQATAPPAVTVLLNADEWATER